MAGAIILKAGDVLTNWRRFQCPNLQILAMDEPFSTIPSGHCILNGPTAQALGVKQPGATILLSLPTNPDQPREAALALAAIAQKDMLSNMRLQVQDIHLASDMISLFNPNGGQRVPYQNAWVNLRELQDRIEKLRVDRVNAIVATDQSGGASEQSALLLNQKLKSIVRLEDYGLTLQSKDAAGDAVLASESGELEPPLVSVAESVAKDANIPLTKVTVNLINTVEVTTSGNASTKAVHYSVAAGLTSLNGQPLGDEQIAINQWMADQLGAKVGDRIRFTFYKRESIRGICGSLIPLSPDSKTDWSSARFCP